MSIRPARYTAQISAMVTAQQKQRAQALRDRDRVAQADILRAALELGLSRLETMSGLDRAGLYGCIELGHDTSAY
jgi:hypothetical protein